MSKSQIGIKVFMVGRKPAINIYKYIYKCVWNVINKSFGETIIYTCIYVIYCVGTYDFSFCNCFKLFQRLHVDGRVPYVGFSK